MWLNSGDSLYSSKILNHSLSVRGGKKPRNGLHSTIESPLPVNLVAPPIKIITTTKKLIKKNQIEILILILWNSVINYSDNLYKLI